MKPTNNLSIHPIHPGTFFSYLCSKTFANMYKEKRRFFIFSSALTLIFCSVLIVHSCKKDTLTPVCDGSNLTYNSGINTIINTSCLGSSCHTTSNSRGDFTTYAGLKPKLDNGTFKKRVLEKQSMPKGSTLTQDEINKIQCWADNNYPEN